MSCSGSAGRRLEQCEQRRSLGWPVDVRGLGSCAIQSSVSPKTTIRPGTALVSSPEIRILRFEKYSWLRRCQRSTAAISRLRAGRRWLARPTPPCRTGPRGPHVVGGVSPCVPLRGGNTETRPENGWGPWTRFSHGWATISRFRPFPGNIQHGEVATPFSDDGLLEPPATATGLKMRSL